jgi:hypothetical protein
MPAAAAPAPDPAICPLCGAGNGCAMERQRLTGVEQPPCWCTRVDIRRDLLDSVPEAARGKACICPACASAAAR